MGERWTIGDLTDLRCHLTREQIRELIRYRVRESPESSNHQIASSLGVSHPIVAVV